MTSDILYNNKAVFLCCGSVTTQFAITCCLFCFQYTSVDPRQRRASDGVLCVVKESLSDVASSRVHRSPLLTYKTEPGQENTTTYFTMP